MCPNCIDKMAQSSTFFGRNFPHFPFNLSMKYALTKKTTKDWKMREIKNTKSFFFAVRSNNLNGLHLLNALNRFNGIASVVKHFEVSSHCHFCGFCTSMTSLHIIPIIPSIRSIPISDSVLPVLPILPVLPTLLYWLYLKIYLKKEIYFSLNPLNSKRSSD